MSGRDKNDMSGRSLSGERVYRKRFERGAVFAADAALTMSHALATELGHRVYRYDQLMRVIHTELSLIHI